jgi:hypothetical protein
MVLLGVGISCSVVFGVVIVTFGVVIVGLVVGGMVITPPPPEQTYSLSLKGIWLQDSASE